MLVPECLIPHHLYYTASYRQTKVLSHCIILVGLCYFITETWLSPVTHTMAFVKAASSYLDCYCPIVALIALFRLLLHHFGWLLLYLDYYY